MVVPYQKEYAEFWEILKGFFLFPSVKAKVQNHSVFTNICAVSYAWIPSSCSYNQPSCILPHVEPDSYSR